MDDQRKNESGIVVGCIVVGMLLVILAMGLLVFGGLAELQQRRAMMAEKAAREAQMSAIIAAEKAASEQEVAQPEVK